MQESDIQLAPMQLAIEVRAEVDIELQLRGRMQPRESRKQRRKMSHREAVRHAHAKGADQRVLCAHMRSEALTQAHDLLRVANDLRPAPCNPRALRRTIHDERPCLPLELANPAR